MELLLAVITSVACAYAGIILNVWFKAFTTPNTGRFNWALFWRDNSDSLVITLVGCTIIIPLLITVPELGSLIKTITGLALVPDGAPITTGASVTFGYLLYSLVRNSRKVHQKKDTDASED
jgi:hypothetical protein